jgi:glyoxylase-like metal-dependent hydrolase (beta-lactamase superfamily II)
MAVGDVRPVPGCADTHYVDTGMYDVPEYGSVYVLDGERPALVDTGIGADRERILGALDELGIAREEVELLCPTHVHLDHAGGAGFLARACPNATVVCHGAGVRHLVDPSRLVAGTKAAVGDQWGFYADPEPVPEDRIEGVTDGDVVDLGDRRLRVHGAPGHAPHHVVFEDRRESAVFTGDAAGIWLPSLARLRQTTPPPQFDLEACHRDADAVAGLAPETLCFGHFGPRAFDADLLAGYKRTLVEWVEAVRETREELEDDDAVVERFAERVDADLFDVWGERKARAEERLNVRGALAYLDGRSA